MNRRRALLLAVLPFAIGAATTAVRHAAAPPGSTATATAPPARPATALPAPKTAPPLAERATFALDLKSSAVRLVAADDGAALLAQVPIVRGTLTTGAGGRVEDLALELDPTRATAADGRPLAAEARRALGLPDAAAVTLRARAAAQSPGPVAGTVHVQWDTVDAEGRPTADRSARWHTALGWLQPQRLRLATVATRAEGLWPIRSPAAPHDLVLDLAFRIPSGK